MELDRELLNRYIDGELSPRENARVAELVSRHPDWSDYVGQQEKLKRLLRASLDELGAGVPDRLNRAVMEAPVSWRWRLRAGLGQILAPARLIPIGGALAAGLAIGILLMPRGEFVAGRSGQMLARGELAEMLSNRLASNGGAGIGVSFRNKDGRDCRTFSSGANAGLACHGGEGWVIETLIRHQGEDQGAQYRMAGSAMPDAIRRAVEAAIQGEVFDAAQEARARDLGWRGNR